MIFIDHHVRLHIVGIPPPTTEDRAAKENKRPPKLDLKFRENRFNPFDRDLHMEEDYFQIDEGSDGSYVIKSSQC